jgi:site-specific recombinase XerD
VAKSIRLGDLLLQRFKKKRAQPLKHKKLKLKKSKKNRPVFFKVKATATQLVPVPVQLPVAAPVPKPEPQSAPQAKSTDTLNLEEIIHPGEKIKMAIEGFILDQRSPHTQKAYAKDLKRFIKYLHYVKFQKGPEQLTRTLIIRYKDGLLAEKLEHTTIDRHLATLRSFFKWLVEENVMVKSPADGVRFMNPKKISKTIGFLDVEVKQVLSKPNLHTRIGSQHYAILMILFYCGLRRSEVCELRTSNLGEERGHRILKLRGKGNAERVVVMIPVVWNALRHYFRITQKDPTKDAYLFTPIRNNRTGDLDKPLDPSMIYYIVVKYAKEAGVANKVSPHSCRATAISNARDHNVPDRTIQEFAGWASPDMITRYDKRKSSVEKSAAHFIKYGDEKDSRLPGAPQSETNPETNEEISGNDPNGGIAFTDL